MEHTYTLKELAAILKTFPRKAAYLCMLHHVPFCPEGHFHLTKRDITLLDIENGRIPDNDILYYADSPYGY